MSAGGTLQSAIAAALATIEELTGVYDGPPARAAYPYVALDATTEADWKRRRSPATCPKPERPGTGRS